MLKVGQKAPDFTLSAHDQNSVTLSEYEGEKNVVLSFHIFSFTGGWTDQVSLFRSHNAKFEEKDTQVLGISNDARPSQSAYATSLGTLPYPLLSDFHPKGSVTQAYDIWNQERGTSQRAVYIIDKEGIIRFAKTYDTAADFDTRDILNELDAIWRTTMLSASGWWKQSFYIENILVGLCVFLNSRYG